MTNNQWPDEAPVRVSLRYRGPSVDDGSMPVADVLNALSGFTGAYGKIASKETPNIQHKLSVSSFKSNSFDIVLLSVCMVLQDPETQRTILETISGAGGKVIRHLLSLIKAHKHTKGKPSTINVSGSGNTVNLINAEGATLHLTKAEAENFKDDLAAKDIGKIVRPLRQGEVNSLELSMEDDNETSSALIDCSEREYFDSNEAETTTTKETKIKGRFVSLNKERDSGSFRLLSGLSIGYHYSGDDQQQLYQDFAHKGLVLVTCVATLDEDLQPLRLSIYEVERLQRSLPLQDDAEV